MVTLTVSGRDPEGSALSFRAALVDRHVEVHLEPASGRYGIVTTARRGETIRPRSFPGVEVAVSDVVR